MVTICRTSQTETTMGTTSQEIQTTDSGEKPTGEASKPDEKATEEKAASADEKKDNDDDITLDAINMLAQGKRNLVCGEVPIAVNQLQEACKLLALKFGETADECAEAYFTYGKALLDLSRMESGVLGNALQGSKCDQMREISGCNCWHEHLLFTDWNASLNSSSGNFFVVVPVSEEEEEEDDKSGTSSEDKTEDEKMPGIYCL